MSLTVEPFTFRPPEHLKGLRLVLGVVLSVFAVGGAAFGAAVIWLPRSLNYEVTQDHVVITSGLEIRPTRREIPLGSITSATAIRLKPGKRVNGTSLPGYCAGHYRFPDLGDCTLATTCSPDAVVIHISGGDRPFVITPGQREVFLEALSGAGQYRETVRSGEDSSVWLGLKAVTALGAAATLFIPLIFFLSPSRLRYRVTPGHVEVDLTFGAKRFSVSNCIARLYNPETSSKVIGSSLPGYHSGRFSLDGMATRVYATRLTEGVLIESPDLRLFLNPEDPHAFLEALRALGNMEIE
ncbi:MAG: hypothetical protein KAJ78_06440 [Acidobacteria bacterium]|nr:hypothetical protein [Acidobacteriota bacterium]